MQSIKNLFCSFKIILPIMAIYATACAIATFIENDYGTRVAQLKIYSTWWFNTLHLYLLIALTCTLFSLRYWQQKKYASLLLHASFIFIILGAGITRFFSFEGVMHIREGEKSSFITASNLTLNIIAIKNNQHESYFLTPPLEEGYNKSIKIKIFDKTLELSQFIITKISPSKKDDSLSIKLSAHYEGITQDFLFLGGERQDLKFAKADFHDTRILISWGKRQIPLPFILELKKFELTRYPGSMSPSSYASEINVLDKEGKHVMPYRIFMNNVLDYKGYRFYQSSYDQDEKGTILSVNKDPGKNMTYFGYTLLILGAIWVLFSKNGRFRKLANFLQEQKIVLFLVGLFALSTPPILHAQDIQNLTPEQMAQFVNNFKNTTKHHTKKFAKIQLQNYSGRIEPIDTIATNIVHKITKKDGFLGMDNMQMFLGMMLYPNIWKNLKIIAVNDQEIKKILGLKPVDTHASFSDFFEDSLGYKLHNHIEEANQTNPSKRNTFEKNLLKIDERVNLTYSIFSGSFLKIFPLPDTQNWLDPISFFQQASPESSHQVSNLLKELFEAFDQGVNNNQWKNLDSALAKITTYQKEYGHELYLPENRIKAEIFLNHSNYFSKLILPYILLGLLLFILVIYFILKDKQMPKWLNYTLYILLLVCTITHTIGLGLRWYVSEHSPWSNAYESMLYIAWASAIAGAIFFRKYNIALASSMFLAGISLFVANLGFMDPQITPLVPVLKSYWLNIHVSIITASYGFLGLCFIMGCITLILFVLQNFIKNTYHLAQITKSINSLYALNEMSMILGLLMLTIGNFLGGIWANESWGRYWSWDPKETWALISIGVYAIILHLRFLNIKQISYVFSLASVIGFYSILMTYFGVNYYLSGMHSYASGDPFPIPTFVYIFVAITILLIILAIPKRR